MSTQLRRVAVYCGARFGNSPSYALAAESLGRHLALANIGIVYGGSKNGLMNIVANSALDAGGEVLGVIPTQFQKQEQAHPNLTELMFVDTIHERKAKMLELADAIIALPGGGGTLDELAEAYGWAKMGVHKKPCLCLDVDNFWQPLFDLFGNMQTAGFMSESMPLLRATDPVQAIHLLQQALTSN